MLRAAQFLRSHKSPVLRRLYGTRCNRPFRPRTLLQRATVPLFVLSAKVWRRVCIQLYASSLWFHSKSRRMSKYTIGRFFFFFDAKEPVTERQ